MLLPTGHCVLSVACASQTVQPVHVLANVAFVVPEYVPAEQESQFALPWFTAYVPATQSRHALATVAPVVGRYVPALQSSHVVEPLLIAKDPVAQGVHARVSVT